MNSLNIKTLANSPIGALPYDKNQIKSGILHFGVGNFHRSHQAVYCHQLLSRGDTHWGITGVSLRSPSLRNALAPQDYLYTHITLSQQQRFSVIGALQKILVAPENPQAVIDAIANIETQLITCTITEKAYGIVNGGVSGTVDITQINFKRDLLSLDSPSSIYGFIAAGIIQRMQAAPSAAMTVLCCDNMQSGGRYLYTGVITLLEQHHPSAARWTQANVSFISSMVDRVSPATNNAHRTLVAEQCQFNDVWPVATEPFSQWVIEDNFKGERPPFDQVGAVFVKDIQPFEEAKLRLLNGAHSMIAALGYLYGDTFIHQTFARNQVFQFVYNALFNNALPVTEVPTGIEADTYITQIFDRFKNTALPYTVLQVGSDSSQKIQQRWFSVITQQHQQHHDCRHYCFAIAAWLCYVEQALTRGELNDPLAQPLAQALNVNITDDIDQDLLHIIGADKHKFYQDKIIKVKISKYHHQIKQLGVVQALQKINTDS